MVWEYSRDPGTAVQMTEDQQAFLLFTSSPTRVMFITHSCPPLDLNQLRISIITDNGLELYCTPISIIKLSGREPKEIILMVEILKKTKKISVVNKIFTMILTVAGSPKSTRWKKHTHLKTFSPSQGQCRAPVWPRRGSAGLWIGFTAEPVPSVLVLCTTLPRSISSHFQGMSLADSAFD